MPPRIVRSAAAPHRSQTSDEETALEAFPTATPEGLGILWARDAGIHDVKPSRFHLRTQSYPCS
jgi:hypothetical protein